MLLFFFFRRKSEDLFIYFKFENVQCFNGAQASGSMTIRYFAKGILYKPMDIYVWFAFHLAPLTYFFFYFLYHSPALTFQRNMIISRVTEFTLLSLSNFFYIFISSWGGQKFEAFIALLLLLLFFHFKETFFVFSFRYIKSISYIYTHCIIIIIVQREKFFVEKKEKRKIVLFAHTRRLKRQTIFNNCYCPR